jgi:hypothetical protein
MVRCAACGRSWIECRDLEVIDVPARNLSVPVETASPPEIADREVKRLSDASLAAQQAFAAKRRERLQRQRSWAAFAAAVAMPVALAWWFPEPVVRAAPAAVRLYEKAGIAVNVYGLDIRHIEQQHIILDGTRVLTVKGHIVNVSGSDRKVPTLRFILRDGAQNEVYAWTVESGVRPLRPGEITNFTTRVASPPAEAAAIQIRFARIDEIGSNADP